MMLILPSNIVIIFGQTNAQIHRTLIAKKKAGRGPTSTLLCAVQALGQPGWTGTFDSLPAAPGRLPDSLYAPFGVPALP